MYESSYKLDSKYKVKYSTTPPLSFYFSKKKFWRISRTKVFLSEAQCNYWTKGRFWRTLCQVIVCIMVMWEFSNQMCEILGNSIMILVLDFWPSDQIVNISLNDLRRWVSNHHKTLTWYQMDEPSVELHLALWVISRVTPQFSLHFLKNHFLEDPWNYGFA